MSGVTARDVRALRALVRLTQSSDVDVVQVALAITHPSWSALDVRRQLWSLREALDDEAGMRLRAQVVGVPSALDVAELARAARASRSALWHLLHDRDDLPCTRHLRRPDMPIELIPPASADSSLCHACEADDDDRASGVSVERLPIGTAGAGGRLGFDALGWYLVRPAPADVVVVSREAFRAAFRAVTSR